MKKVLAVLTAMVLSISLLAACSTGSDSSTGGSTAPSGSAAAADSGSTGGDGGTKSVAISLADSTDYYIGTMVGANVEEAFRGTGANVDVLDAGNVISTQIQQIQNAATKGADIIYVFPIGDAEAYQDVLREVRDQGVTVMVSNTYPGDGACDVYVGSEEFYMGAMMAKMISAWIDEALPDQDNVKALILESHLNETMAHRCLGMRLVAEKFLRQGDLETMYFVKTEGGPVNYIDADGNEQPVDEPTGGLILDSDGNAILNPFYDERVELIEESNRVTTAFTPPEAQNAIEAAVTNGNDDLQIVFAYGDVGIPCSEKVMELVNSGSLTNPIDKVAVFCSDATDNNQQAMKDSVENTTVLRGVMAAGDLVATLQDYAVKLVNDEDVPEVTMEPLSYVLADKNGELVTVKYDDVEQLTPDISEFFK